MDKIVRILESPNGPAVAAGVLALAALCGGVFFLHVRSLLHGIRARLRSRRGLRLEGLAGRVLEREGYKILGEQVPGHVSIRVDGKNVKTTVHADFLAKKGGEIFVADSKSGAASTNPASAEVRRQLLEYCLVYGCRRALLVDMEKHCIRNLEFDFPFFAEKGIGWGAAILLALLAATLTAAAGVFL